MTPEERAERVEEIRGRCSAFPPPGLREEDMDRIILLSELDRVTADLSLALLSEQGANARRERVEAEQGDLLPGTTPKQMQALARSRIETLVEERLGMDAEVARIRAQRDAALAQVETLRDALALAADLPHTSQPVRDAANAAESALAATEPVRRIAANCPQHRLSGKREQECPTCWPTEPKP